MKIAIIGASISGLAAAALLLRQGHAVTLYEQHLESLTEQGAGITITPELVNALQQHNLLSQDLPLIHIMMRSIIGLDPHHQTQIIDEQNFSARSVHWQTLYENLKAKVPQERIKTGHRVVKIEGTTLTLMHHDQKTDESFDLILGADGHHSLTAKTICNEVKSEYAGYIAWRGTTPVNGFENRLLQTQVNAMFGSAQESKAVYFVYPLGHCIMYLIHSPDTQNILINWVLYEKREAHTLQNVLPTHSESGQYKTIPRGHLSVDQKKYLHQFAKKLAPIAQCIIMNTPEPFIQPIYAIRPDLRITPECNIALLGDAAGTVPPQAGSGAVRGLTDALQITKAVEQNALNQWGISRLEEDKKLYALGERMQDFWVLRTPNWQQMTATDFENMWKKVIANEAWYTPSASKPKL